LLLSLKNNLLLGGKCLYQQPKRKRISSRFQGYKKQKDELQKWAIFFYRQKSVDPETRIQVPVIGKPEIGLLIKEATYTFIYQHKFFLQTRTYPQLMQSGEQFQRQLAGQNALLVANGKGRE
jgi:hypothetical protein